MVDQVDLIANLHQTQAPGQEQHGRIELLAPQGTKFLGRLVLITEKEDLGAELAAGIRARSHDAMVIAGITHEDEVELLEGVSIEKALAHDVLNLLQGDLDHRTRFEELDQHELEETGTDHSRIANEQTIELMVWRNAGLIGRSITHELERREVGLDVVVDVERFTVFRENAVDGPDDRVNGEVQVGLGDVEHHQGIFSDPQVPIAIVNFQIPRNLPLGLRKHLEERCLESFRGGNTLVCQFVEQPAFFSVGDETGDRLDLAILQRTIRIIQLDLGQNSSNSIIYQRTTKNFTTPKSTMQECIVIFGAPGKTDWSSTTCG